MGKHKRKAPVCCRNLAYGLVFNNRCTAAPRNAIEKDFDCDHKFSEAVQSDMMAMSGNIYALDNKETATQFENRYKEYTNLLGGDTTLLTSSTPKNILDPQVTCGFTHVATVLIHAAIVICRSTVVSFSDISTIITDLQPHAVPVDVGTGLVNDGFNKAYESVKLQLDNLLSKLPADYPIFCGGHSSGGSIASLLCNRAKAKHKSNVCGIYTFGSPRYGTASFADKYHSTLVTYRYENSNDPVPQLPTTYPQPVFLGQQEGYVSLGSVPKGKPSVCSMGPRGVREPNYFQIVISLALIAKNVPITCDGTCCDAKNHLPALYCSKLPHPSQKKASPVPATLTPTIPSPTGYSNPASCGFGPEWAGCLFNCSALRLCIIHAACTPGDIGPNAGCTSPTCPQGGSVCCNIFGCA